MATRFTKVLPMTGQEGGDDLHKSPTLPLTQDSPPPKKVGLGHMLLKRPSWAMAQRMLSSIGVTPRATLLARGRSGEEGGITREQSLRSDTRRR